MDWTEIFIVFVLSHLVGDFLLQTDFQALHKRGGLGPDPTSRKALLTHVGFYTLAFVPGLVWAADSVVKAIWLAALIGIPHAVVDDGRLLRAYIDHVKRARDPGTVVLIGADQSTHMLCLFGAALLAAT